LPTVSTSFLASKGPTPREGKCGAGYLFMNFMLQKAPRPLEGKGGSGYLFKSPHAPLRGNVDQDIVSI
jgi:hypothetical protein